MDSTDGALTFEPPLRMYNLSGGLSCLSGSNGLNWLMLPGEFGLFWNDLAGVNSSSFIKDHFDIVSTNAYRVAEDMSNIFSNDTFFVPIDGYSFPVETLIQRWNGLSVAYRNRSLFQRGLRAERIANQIRFCIYNCITLFKTYRSCLSEQLTEEKVCRFSEGRVSFFSDVFANEIGNRLQPCLDSIFSLRDFVFSFLFEEMYGTKVKLSKALSFVASDDRYALLEVISEALGQGDSPGIVTRTCLYRNVFFHYIGSSAGPVGQVYLFEWTESPLGQLPRLTFPLDDDIARLRAIERGTFSGYGNREEHRQEAQRFMSSGSYVDALDLCVEALRVLIRLANTMEQKIEMMSETIIINEADIIEATITRDGNRTKYKRDAEGKLAIVETECSGE